MKKISLCLGAALLATSSLSFAQSYPQGSQGGMGERPHGPPPEIIAACSGRPIGTQVQVTFRNGHTRVITCGEHHHHGQRPAQ